MSSARITRDLCRHLLNAEAAVLGAKRAKELDVRVCFGRKLDLSNPKTLTDKICWI